MAFDKNQAVVKEIRTLFNVGAVGELSDGQLLERFATDRGEAAELAFAVVVERGGATVECGLRQRDRSWRLGLASYQLDEFCWYRIFGLSTRPEQTFPRRDLAVVAHRAPTEQEVTILGPGRVVVECQTHSLFDRVAVGTACGLQITLGHTGPQLLISFAVPDLLK